MNKYLVTIILFLLNSIDLVSCDWCKNTHSNTQYTYAEYCMKQYLKYCVPTTKELLSLYKTMCIDGFSIALKTQIELLSKQPQHYFHVSHKNFSADHLLNAVKTFQALIQFIHSHTVNLKTKKIAPYLFNKKNNTTISIHQYLKTYGKPDIFGCLLLDDLYAYALSYVGTLFNSMLLKQYQELNQQEIQSLWYLYNTLDFLTSQLRHTPYQQHAEKSFKIWSRLFKEIEKEWNTIQQLQNTK